MPILSLLTNPLASCPLFEPPRALVPWGPNSRSLPAAPAASWRRCGLHPSHMHRQNWTYNSWDRPKHLHALHSLETTSWKLTPIEPDLKDSRTSLLQGCRQSQREPSSWERCSIAPVPTISLSAKQGERRRQTTWGQRGTLNSTILAHQEQSNA